MQRKMVLSIHGCLNVFALLTDHPAVFQEADCGSDELPGAKQQRGAQREDDGHLQGAGVHLQVHRALAQPLRQVSLRRLYVPSLSSSQGGSYFPGCLKTCADKVALE